MKEKLVYKIGGKEYLLVEHLITAHTSMAERERIDKKLEKLGVISQGIKEIKKGWLGGGYAIIKLLVPVKKLKEYNKIM